MSVIQISPPSETSGSPISLELPLSKSIVNRVLIIQAGLSLELPNLSGSVPRDIHIMRDNLIQRSLISKGAHPTLFNAQDAGTVYRFLTALLAFTPGVHELTGTSRMSERPIAPLVEVLLRAGAQIQYLGRNGYPPLKIEGIRPPEDIKFEFDNSSSSQYISACMLVAPLFRSGITVIYPKSHLSGTYIELTLEILREFGAKIQTIESSDKRSQMIKFNRVRSGTEPFTETDWSSAAFAFAIGGLLRNTSLRVSGLNPRSAQGDRVAFDLFSNVGVNLSYSGNSLLIESGIRMNDPGVIDFSTCPDLAPPYIVYCALKGIPFSGVGLEHLRIKESDRIIALQQNLKQIGLELVGSSGVYSLKGELKWKSIPCFDSFDDHRIAMSFALCGSLFPVQIKGAESVKKSFPEFWTQLRHIGFNIEEVD